MTQLAEHGLIDEYQIMVDPVALGGGRGEGENQHQQRELFCLHDLPPWRNLGKNNIIMAGGRRFPAGRARPLEFWGGREYIDVFQNQGVKACRNTFIFLLLPMRKATRT